MLFYSRIELLLKLLSLSILFGKKFFQIHELEDLVKQVG